MENGRHESNEHANVGDRSAGVLLAASAVLTVVFMAMHPTGRAHSDAGLMDHLARGFPLNGVVHGVLMALMVPTLVGFIGLSARLCLRLALVRTGLVTYAIGVLAATAAALINGFIVPAVAESFADAGDAGAGKGKSVLVLCHFVNEACAQLCVIGMSSAAICWSLVLMRGTGTRRAVGIIGLICGALPLVALATGHLPMNLHGFGGFLLLQAIWGVSVAIPLYRGRI